jgi:hypothetical protein
LSTLLTDVNIKISNIKHCNNNNNIINIIVIKKEIMPGYTLTLNNGKKMPLVGHGLWKIPNDKIADRIYTAIKAGYRLFDGVAG